MAPGCWLFWTLWLPMMLAVAAAEEQQGEGCSDSAKRCGNTTISRPFWLRHNVSERACGLSDFEVTCVHNTPVLQSSLASGYGFAFVNISYEERSLHVVDVGKRELLSNNCLPLWNTSAKLGVQFMINPSNLNLILYKCMPMEEAVARRDRDLVETRIRCRNESRQFARAGVRHDSNADYAGYALERCEAIVVPVLGSSGKMRGSDYGRLIDDGFLLTWKPPRKLARQIIF